jgi:methionine synthase I (cobalamin-dependent)
MPAAQSASHANWSLSDRAVTSARFQELLASRPVVTDGAWGTQCQEQGLPIGACPDGWNLAHPDRVEALARAYVAAGSRVILTNTFGANRMALGRHGLADRVIAINRTGVEISRRAVGGRAAVFASMGPTGRLMAAGEISAAEARAAFAEQAGALAEAGADALLIETMTDLREAVEAVHAAHATALPVVACMVFNATPAGYRTLMGDRLEQAAEELECAGADALGANCGHGPAAFAGICAQLRARTRLPVWIKPNAGLPCFVAERTGALYDTTPEAFAAEAKALVASGADFIGGCCGTGPEFIRALAHGLDA